MIAANLNEILLSVVLLFNVGAYTFLWNELKRERRGRKQIKEEVSSVRTSLNHLRQRIFGLDHDQTEQGYLVESEDRFDNIDEHLEQICIKIDDMKEERRDRHEEVKSQIETIVDILGEEENISVERSDVFKDEIKDYK